MVSQFTVARYFNELRRAYPKGTKFDYGFDSPVPAPRGLDNYQGYIRKLMTQWWGLCRVLAMSKFCQVLTLSVLVDTHACGLQTENNHIL